MTVGLVHGELASLLWGGAFSFVWAYTLVARKFTQWQSSAQSARGSLEWVPTPTPRLVFRTESLPPVPAFFDWWLVVDGVHSPQRRFALRVPLTQELTMQDLELPRGRYQVTVRWELADVFGFTRWSPRPRWEDTLTIAPQPIPFSPPPPSATKPGPWRPRRAGRRAGDPFDVRKYTPGDDLRRLHWPLYAHAGELFVRTAEPSPPPTGHQFLVLDTEAPSEEHLDKRLGALVTWLAVLDTQGTGWTLVVPSAQGPLAALHPAPLVATPEPSWPETVTLLTGPGSHGAEALARRLTESKRRVRTIVIEAPAPAPRPLWWKRA